MPGGNAGCDTQLHTQIETSKMLRCIAVVFLTCAKHKSIYTSYESTPCLEHHPCIQFTCCVGQKVFEGGLNFNRSSLPCTSIAMATAPPNNMQLAAAPYLPYSIVACLEDKACSPTPSLIKKPALCLPNVVPGKKAILHQTCICRCKFRCEVITAYSSCSRMMVRTALPRTEQLLLCKVIPSPFTVQREQEQPSIADVIVCIQGHSMAAG